MLEAKCEHIKLSGRKQMIIAIKEIKSNNKTFQSLSTSQKEENLWKPAKHESLEADAFIHSIRFEYS